MPNPDAEGKEPQTTTKWIRLEVTAELLEDAHLGTGSGGGGIDALVARDRDNQPVIWASHLEGVLRDAATRLCGENAANDFFGERAGQQQRTIFTSLYASSSAPSRIWRSSARAAFDNRAPKEDTLRAVEHVPKSTKFIGEVELRECDRAFLVRLFQEVGAIGRGRAKGAGRVSLTIADKSSTPRLITGTPTGRLILELHNRDPLCITATATPGNLIPSLSFVPGRAILGCLANRLLQEGHLDVANLLVTGKISVSDALPLPREFVSLSTIEVLPAPLSLQSQKPSGSMGPIPWWATEQPQKQRLDAHVPRLETGEKLKRPEDDLFVCRASANEPWVSYRPTLRVRLRNGRSKPNQEDPDLFAVEQIAERTRFRCEIQGTKDHLEKLASALNGVFTGSRWLRVGRSGVPVEVVRAEWVTAATPPVATADAIVTLTSDLLVRDDKLRWCQTLQNAMRYLPNWPNDIAVSQEEITQDTVNVYGFNGTSRLWRMPAMAIRRGSVFGVSGNGIAKLTEMISQQRWLGERTHEGFGRFRIDQILPGVTSDPIPCLGEPTTTQTESNSDESIAATTKAWFEQHQSLAKSNRTSENNRAPSLSQWNDLVQEFEGIVANAFTSRFTPTTAAAKNWQHPDAIAVLKELEGIPQPHRADHARYFVRWLRANIRRKNL